FSSNNINNNNYIIVLKPNLSKINITNHIQRIQKFHTSSSPSTNLTSFASISPIHTSTIGNFQFYSSQLNDESLLNNDEAIHYYVKDIPMSLQELVQSNPPSWGLDRIDQRNGKLNQQYRFPTSQGRDVNIYILDTGVTRHDDLKDRITYGPSFINEEDTIGDPNGHGTFVAGVCCGTEYGVAKKANIISIKTLDSEGNGMLSDLLKGLSYVVEQHISQNNSKSIVNLSLGAFYNQAANDAIENAISLGIHVTIAAGNYGEDACKYSPGSASGAVTVGATDPDDSIASYSNFGQCVDIFAPGTDIVSIWNDDDEHTMSGTSMAAPHVSGVMALFLSEKDYTPKKLQTQVKHVSSKIRNDFEIDMMGNDNKSVADNAINDGYRVNGYNGSTLANILFNHPLDGYPTYIYLTSSVNSNLNNNSLIQSFILIIFSIFISL
ncbi:hypothetical protein INT45_013909, partial [Circinella minor]